MSARTIIRELIQSRLGCPTTSRASPDPSTIGVVAAQILKLDSRRIAAQIINLSTQVIYVTPIGVPSATIGIRLEPNGGALALSFLEDGEVVAWEWLALATGALSNYLALETLIGTES